MAAGGAVRRRGRGFQNSGGGYHRAETAVVLRRLMTTGFKGNDGTITTEPKYERLETKDGDTRAARCKLHQLSLLCVFA